MQAGEEEEAWVQVKSTRRKGGGTGLAFKAKARQGGKTAQFQSISFNSLTLESEADILAELDKVKRSLEASTFLAIVSNRLRWARNRLLHVGLCITRLSTDAISIIHHFAAKSLHTKGGLICSYVSESATSLRPSPPWSSSLFTHISAISITCLCLHILLVLCSTHISPRWRLLCAKA